MKYKLENESHSVGINETGAEICSFVNKSTGIEYIWQGNPEFWASTAPVLFPIIGALKEGEYSYKGDSYSVPKHGFIRNNKDLIFHQVSSNKLSVKFSSNEVLKKTYPFDFDFELVFELNGNRLAVTHNVQNVGSNDMLFSLGGHPAFNCPLLEGESYDDYFLEFERKETLNTTVLSNQGLQTDQTYEVVSNSNELSLEKDLFANDALIFKDISSKVVSLKSRNHSHTVRVRYSDFTNLGIWAKYGAPFVCIEPWLGVTDHEYHNGVLEEKEGIIKLPKGESFSASFTIEIN